MLIYNIESYKYISDEGLVSWLRESIDQGKYKNVHEKLSELIKEEGGTEK